MSDTLTYAAPKTIISESLKPYHRHFYNWLKVGALIILRCDCGAEMSLDEIREHINDDAA